MGKAFKWFRGLLGALKKPEQNPDPAPKKKWSFAIAKSHKEKDRHKPQHNVVPSGHSSSDARKHANTVVRLAGSGGGLSSAACVSQRGFGYGSREERAAITIQSHFRAYLSRRALRALKALVKLQALVRGHILRKQIADVLRQMQALARAQQRARTARVLIAEAPKLSTKSSHLKHTGPAAQEKVEQMLRAWSMKLGQNMMPKISVGKSSGSISIDPEKSHLSHGWVDGRTGERSWEQGCLDDRKNDKILVIDNGKPHTTPKRRNMFYSSELSYSPDQYGQSFSTSKDSTTRRTTLSSEVQSSSPLKFGRDMDESPLCTAECSPQLCSASSVGGRAKRGAFTPTKSNGLRSRLSGYSDHPNYMAYTESSKAKARSLSAPKQRPQHERSSSINRYSVHGYGDSRPNTEKVSASHASFTNKAYPGSGHLDRLGMPMAGDFPGFNSGPWHRY